MTAPHEHSTEPVEWTSHPARQRPRDAVMAVFVVMMVAGAAGIFGGGSGWAVLAVVVLLLALNRFFFPSRFKIDEQGITASYPIRRQKLKWNRVRRFIHDDNGGYLSTRARRSWTDAYRGMHIQFGDDRRGIIDLINAKVAEAQRRRESDEPATPQPDGDNESAMRIAIEGGAS